MVGCGDRHGLLRLRGAAWAETRRLYLLQVTWAYGTGRSWIGVGDGKDTSSLPDTALTRDDMGRGRLEHKEEPLKRSTLSSASLGSTCQTLVPAPVALPVVALLQMDWVDLQACDCPE